MTPLLNFIATEKRTQVEAALRARATGVPLPNGDTLCRVLGEWPMVVTLADLSVAPHLVLNGYWEMWVTTCLIRRIEPSWQCIDVGANFGYYTLLLAHLTGSAASIEAWEPQRGLCERLEKTLRLNGLTDRVTVRTLAAGGEPGRARLRADPHDRGGAEIVRAENGAVDIRPLTDTKLGKVDFVKIDAEGMEPEIWSAGISFLKPRAVLLEWSPEKYADPPEFMAKMRSDGYTVGRVTEHGDVTVLKTPEEHAALSGIRGWEALWLERKA